MDLGQPVTSGKQRELQEIVIQLANWKSLPAFPGAQPIILDRIALKVNLLKKKYYASEKSDGYRYLLLILNNGVFLIDALFRVRNAPMMRFPSRLTMTPQHHTLLDGEMVQDRMDDSKFTLRFLIHDVLTYNGNNVMKQKLPDRLKIIQNDIIWPRKNDTNKSHDYSKEPFGVRLKDYYELRHLPFLVKEVIPSLPHPNEGLVFTPLDFPYVVSLNKNLLKWKPLPQNSVDFQLGIEWRDRKPGFKLLVTDMATRTAKDYSWVTFTEEEANRVSKQEGKIVECVWDPNRKTYLPKKGVENWEDGTFRNGGWKLLRLREDKKTANDEQMVEHILRSIEDNITSDELLSLLVPKERNSQRPNQVSPKMQHKSDTSSKSIPSQDSQSEKNDTSPLLGDSNSQQDTLSPTPNESITSASSLTLRASQEGDDRGRKEEIRNEFKKHLPDSPSESSEDLLSSVLKKPKLESVSISNLLN